MSAGLRRFRDPKPALRGPEPAARAGERCEMCAAPIGETHAHVVNIASRALQCACRPCYLLFTAPGAARGKYRAVGERYRYEPRFVLAERVWEAAGIPVSMAFLFANSESGQIAAFYPSPAGATESLLPSTAWTELLADNPAFADLEPDVEALLLMRGPDGFEAFGVPIDACYRLVGLVRQHWRGFDGGSEAWTAINDFFDDLRARSEPVGAAHGR